MSERRGRPVRLHELLGGDDVLGWVGDPDVAITSITHDSRCAVRGGCFACIPGATTDGHDHAPEAVAAGASALLVERDLDLPVSQARVRSVREVLGPAAAAFYGHPSRELHCLGVTGTNGKTTTTYLLEQIVQSAGLRAGVVGTVGARLDGVAVPLARTTPEADDLQALLARMRDEGLRYAALEVSSHALDQHRVDGTWFVAACFTNLTQDHLDYHGSMERYFEAKASLFHPKRVATAAVNIDDRNGREIERRATAAGIPVVTFGLSDERRGQTVDVHAENIELGSTGSRFTLVSSHAGARVPVATRLIGRHNVANAVAAAATAIAAGFPARTAAAGLERPVAIPGRLERIDEGQPFTVFVDYAHTPDGLERLLEVTRPLAGGGRVILVFGCGGDRDRAKRPAMGRVAAAGADNVIVTSDNPRSEDPRAIANAIVDGLRSASSRVVVELDRRAAIATAVQAAGPGDVVVIAGKGHETGQTTGNRTVPFDDRAVAREELGAIGWR
jgi:UDP-N-acetylmuramoyl-L-alanyl-D-glutamate--2,6-diaminopimelate ligase